MRDKRTTLWVQIVSITCVFIYCGLCFYLVNMVIDPMKASISDLDTRLANHEKVHANSVTPLREKFLKMLNGTPEDDLFCWDCHDKINQERWK